MSKIHQSLDAFYKNQLNEQEVESLAQTLGRFLDSYVQNKDQMPLNEWLENAIQKELPNVDIKEIKTTAHDIIEVIKCINEEKEDLLKAKNKGASIKSWLMDKIKKFVAPEQVDETLKELKKANIYDSLELARREDEQVDLDVVEPEVIEAQLEEESGSPVMDKVQEFAEESLKRTALATAQSAGKYILENPDFNFSGILDAACTGAKEEVKTIIDETLNGKTSADTLKAIAGGALSVFTKTNQRELLPIKTGGVFGGIASTTIENMKTLKDLAEGKISTTEAVSDMAANTAATVAGTVVGEAAGKIGMAAGAKVGATIGSIFGPAGAAIGATVGGAIGKFAGKVIGSKVVQGAAKVAKKVASAAVEGVKAIGRGIANVAKSAWEGVKSIGRGIASFFGF
ncbi:glycine zipper domain-containing protein [Campylobacter magnus]|uniref:glycine zipper domain-containing protein n=1 Tax=Campylobacter magnus TaxID=3026462 RepID=UPI0026E0AB86|nr:glycine zipper domain-containing protein [Campylobacter magnus]MDO2408420.1 hypothetical protein [Campylobacter magnus]